METNRFETEFAGKKVIIESGRLATQASAAVTVQMGGTVVLAPAATCAGIKVQELFPSEFMDGRDPETFGLFVLEVHRSKYPFGFE